MSKAEIAYIKSVMERLFKTMKFELISHFPILQ